VITKYVINTPSRTGSTFLRQLLGQTTRLPTLHIHNPFFQDTDPGTTCMILLSRRNLFSAIMSCLVNKRITLEQVDTFIVDCEKFDSEFVHQYNWHKWYNQSCDLSLPYAQIEYLYFEDFITNPDFILEKFKITKKSISGLPTKTPYQAIDLVSNYKECEEKFNWLEKNQPVTLIQKPHVLTTQQIISAHRLPALVNDVLSQIG